MSEEVIVPTWALRYVLENVDFIERGAGWSSPEMDMAHRVLVQALLLQEREGE